MTTGEPRKRLPAGSSTSASPARLITSYVSRKGTPDAQTVPPFSAGSSPIDPVSIRAGKEICAGFLRTPTPQERGPSRPALQESSESPGDHQHVPSTRVPGDFDGLYKASDNEQSRRHPLHSGPRGMVRDAPRYRPDPRASQHMNEDTSQYQPSSLTSHRGFSNSPSPSLHPSLANSLFEGISLGRRESTPPASERISRDRDVQAWIESTGNLQGVQIPNTSLDRGEGPASGSQAQYHQRQASALQRQTIGITRASAAPPVRQAATPGKQITSSGVQAGQKRAAQSISSPSSSAFKKGRLEKGRGK